jgi:hypothetical protein
MSGHRRSSTETYIQSSSGDAQTWPILAGWGVTQKTRTQVVQNDVLVCSGGVDVGRLLRLSRDGLYKKALAVGDSSVTPDKRIVLVNEKCVSFSDHRVFVECLSFMQPKVGMHDNYS